MDDNRTARLDAYKAVRAIVEEHRGVKLFENEANDIIWAAEGLLLAASLDSPDAIQAGTAFNTLVNDLCTHRWADLGPTAERLRRAFADCAPVTVAVS